MEAVEIFGERQLGDRKLVSDRTRPQRGANRRHRENPLVIAIARSCIRSGFRGRRHAAA
jgi:hypothetical protein